MPTGPQERGEDALGVEYWRREAAMHEERIADLEAEIRAMRAPMKFRFRGERDGQYWERDVLRIPEDKWDVALRNKPDLDSWHATIDGGLVFALCPVDFIAPLAQQQEALRNV